MSFVYDYNDHDDLYEDWRLTYGVAELDRGSSQGKIQ